jgi:DNA-binding MarR family transcriptional regulator
MRVTTRDKKSKHAPAVKSAQSRVRKPAQKTARQAEKKSVKARTVKTRSTKTNPAKERLRLWIRMLRTTRAIEADLRERLRTEFASTLPRFDVMSALHRHDHGIKMSELSRLLMVSNGNVTGIVERLAEEGQLIREADPEDRRAARVKLTRKAIKEFERQAQQHQQWIDECLSGISADESADIATLLKQATADMNKR